MIDSFFISNLIPKIKQHHEILIYITLTILLGLSVFIAPISFLVFCFAIGCAFFVKTETIMGICVFLFPFDYLLQYPHGMMRYFLYFFLCVSLVKSYFYDLAKKKRSLNFKKSKTPLIMLILFIIINLHILLTMRELNLSYYLYALSYMVPSLFAYIYRKSLDVKKLIYIFSITLILSGIAFLFKDYSSLLDKSIWKFGSYVRQKGCLDHPNIFAFNVLMALSLLALLYVKKQIPLSHFIPLFMGNFIFGYLTLSRLFILSVFSLLVVFFLVLLSKEKFQAFNFILPFVAMLALVVLIFNETTTNYVVRVKNPYEVGFGEKIDATTQEDWELIYNGEKYFDPGRFGIWQVYITYLSKNPLIVLFGRSLSAPFLGTKHAHNLLLNSIYTYGIVGLIFYCIYTYFLLGGKKLFKLKNFKYMIIVFIPIIIFQTFEKISDISVFYWLLMYNFQNDKFDENEDYEKMHSMLSSNKPPKTKNKLFSTKRLKREFLETF